MNINVLGVGVVNDVEKLENIDDVVYGTRLFYEHGRYISKRQIPENWRRNGKFIEIENVLQFITDLRFTNKDFINHHNFMIKRK